MNKPIQDVWGFIQRVHEVTQHTSGPREARKACVDAGLEYVGSGSTAVVIECPDDPDWVWRVSRDAKTDGGVRYLEWVRNAGYWDLPNMPEVDLCVQVRGSMAHRVRKYQTINSRTGLYPGQEYSIRDAQKVFNRAIQDGEPKNPARLEDQNMVPVWNQGQWVRSVLQEVFPDARVFDVHTGNTMWCSREGRIVLIDVLTRNRNIQI